jgi:hypothetical protein
MWMGFPIVIAVPLVMAGCSPSDQSNNLNGSTEINSCIPLQMQETLPVSAPGGFGPMCVTGFRKATKTCAPENASVVAGSESVSFEGTVMWTKTALHIVEERCVQFEGYAYSSYHSGTYPSYVCQPGRGSATVSFSYCPDGND